MNLHRFVLAATVVAALAVSPVAGMPACKPELTVTDVMFSQVHRSQRIWSARIAVDASRCAESYGTFEIAFVRLKETAPDMRFTEQYAWTPGMIVVAADFAADEAVADYAIAAAACSCR